MCLVPPSGSSNKKKKELDVTYWLHQFSPWIYFFFLLWHRNNLNNDIEKFYYSWSCISCCDLIQTPPDVWRCVSRQTINWTHKYPWGGGWMLLPFCFAALFRLKNTNSISEQGAANTHHQRSYKGSKHHLLCSI